MGGKKSQSFPSFNSLYLPLLISFTPLTAFSDTVKISDKNTVEICPGSDPAVRRLTGRSTHAWGHYLVKLPKTRVKHMKGVGLGVKLRKTWLGVKLTQVKETEGLKQSLHPKFMTSKVRKPMLPVHPRKQCALISSIKQHRVTYELSFDLRCDGIKQIRQDCLRRMMYIQNPSFVSWILRLAYVAP